MRHSQFVSVFLVFVLSNWTTAAERSRPTTPSAATESDVCEAIDLLNRSIDQVLAARNVPPPAEPINHEHGLRLEHVYQLHTACLEQLHQIEADRQIGRIPPLAAARPGAATADDVVALSKLMHDELKRPAWILWVVKLPEERAGLSSRTADDAFVETLRLYVKMNALADKRQVTADEVCSQVTRCVADAKAVLQHLDDAHRYRIDAPVTASPKQAEDLNRQCLAVRGTLQGIARELNQAATPAPDASFTAAGEDVFVQTQIVLAEINRLKLGLGVTASTPLAVRVEGQTWTDAYNQAVLLNYLLAQFGEVRRMTAN